MLKTLYELLPRAKDWSPARKSWRVDLLAGLTVAIVALPLALAFGVTSGMGAQAGLITAIIAGAVAAIFGGSNLQVSGPTGAMTVVLVPVVASHGAQGVLLVGVLAGVILIGLAVARLGRLVRFLPLPVIEGFTAGIAVVIALQQFPAALGIEDAEGDKVWQVALDAIVKFVASPNVIPLVMALAVAAAMLFGVRYWPGVPFSLIAVIVSTVVVAAGGLSLESIGQLPAGIPAPNFEFMDLSMVQALLPSAVAVAALAGLESLLSATVADGMRVGERHDPDRELFGQGLANLVSPIFGGIPATAAIARTAVNVRAGARTRLAALSHAVILAAVVYFLSGLVAHIPLAALAGVLLATTVRMVDMRGIRALARATKRDALVLVLTFAVTVMLDLVIAVVAGVIVAVILALRSIARSARLQVVPLDSSDHSEEEAALLAQHVVAYRLEGPLFFAAANRFLIGLTDVGGVKVVILRLSYLTNLDATGARLLGEAIDHLERRGVVVAISGASRVHDAILKALGVAENIYREGRVFSDTLEAIEWARARVQQKVDRGVIKLPDGDDE